MFFNFVMESRNTPILNVTNVGPLAQTLTLKQQIHIHVLDIEVHASQNVLMPQFADVEIRKHVL